MIDGKTMIQRVYEQALRCAGLNEVLVATDDRRIYDHVTGFGRAVMTSARHNTGTERVWEAFEKHNIGGQYGSGDGIINIQGDEPYIEPSQIGQLIGMLRDSRKEVVTLAKRMQDASGASNPNVVKVVFTHSGKALYFSRSPIPHRRDASGSVPQAVYKHIGLYGFRAGKLKELVALEAGSLEQEEKLEQLRWMQHDVDIFVQETYGESHAIDTPGDLQRLLHQLRGG